MTPGIDTQAVGAALLSFIVHGSSFSAAFDAHGARSGQLPGLRRGWLFGRSVVSISVNTTLPAQIIEPRALDTCRINAGVKPPICHFALLVCRTCQTFSGASSGRACRWPQLQWLPSLQPAERYAHCLEGYVLPHHHTV